MSKKNACANQAQTRAYRLNHRIPSFGPRRGENDTPGRTVKRIPSRNRKLETTDDLQQQCCAFSGFDGRKIKPLIYYADALPISAVFGLRYVHTLVRKWAASGDKRPDASSRRAAAEVVVERMGIRRSDQLALVARGAAAVAACLLLANCASSGKFASRVDPRYGVSSSPRVVAFGDPVPKGGGTYRVGKPYTVGGRVYVPEEDVNYREEGLASWYGDDFHGRLTANGEVFDMASLTAAHPTLPMPCYARVTNLSNGKSLIVRVNDRGPYHGNRLIDVSNKAAELLEFKGNGVAHVRVEYVGRAPLEGSDDRQLIATLRTGVPAPSPSLVRVASARAFVPEVSSHRSIRGEVPMPEGRPYSLGNTSADMASINATSEMSASARARPGSRMIENPRAVSYENDERYAPDVRPVSAYVPVDPRGPSELLAGRGLY
jgi:rare lipoprotein A